MHLLHICGATWHLLQRTMEPYVSLQRLPGLEPGGKVTSHVGRNLELPPRLEALQLEPERALSARRPRIGRHRYHPVGHPADRVGWHPAGAFALSLKSLARVSTPTGSPFRPPAICNTENGTR